VRSQIFEQFPHLQTINAITAADWKGEPTGTMSDAPFVSPIQDFYLTNPIARASETMAACSAVAAQKAAPLAAE